MTNETLSIETEMAINAVSLYSCGRCGMCYYDYKLLLEHLYWRHGTESLSCHECALKYWRFAPHVCHVLPIYIAVPDENVDEVEHCFCGMEDINAPMIGCDGPSCAVQWYHFTCVGIVTPPDGDWFCPTCIQTIIFQDGDFEKSRA